MYKQFMQDSGTNFDTGDCLLQDSDKRHKRCQCIFTVPPHTITVTKNKTSREQEEIKEACLMTGKFREEANHMASRSSNRAEVPEAKEALDRFKMEVASELGVPLSNGYNGNLTSAQNGSVGGYMVKKMIEAQERQMAGK